MSHGRQALQDDSAKDPKTILFLHASSHEYSTIRNFDIFTAWLSLAFSASKYTIDIIDVTQPGLTIVEFYKRVTSAALILHTDGLPELAHVFAPPDTPFV